MGKADGDSVQACISHVRSFLAIVVIAETQCSAVACIFLLWLDCAGAAQVSDTSRSKLSHETNQCHANAS